MNTKRNITHRGCIDRKAPARDLARRVAVPPVSQMLRSRSLLRRRHVGMARGQGNPASADRIVIIRKKSVRYGGINTCHKICVWSSPVAAMMLAAHRARQLRAARGLARPFPASGGRTLSGATRALPSGPARNPAEPPLDRTGACRQVTREPGRRPWAEWGRGGVEGGVEAGWTLSRDAQHCLASLAASPM